MTDPWVQSALTRTVLEARRQAVIVESIALVLSARGRRSVEAPESRTDPVVWKWFALSGDTLHSVAASPISTPWPTRTLIATCVIADHPDGDRVGCDCGIFGCLDVADVSRRCIPDAVITRVRLRGRVWTTSDNADPVSTRRAGAATIVGPLHLPPWMSGAAGHLHQRYRLPVVVWCDAQRGPTT